MAIEKIIELYLNIEAEGRQVLSEFSPKNKFNTSQKRLFASGAEIVGIVDREYKRIKDEAFVSSSSGSPRRILKYELIE